MQVVLFSHSLVSDWNHGNAHFLRGVVRELQARGHEVRVLEPAARLEPAEPGREQGAAALERIGAACPPGCVQTSRAPSSISTRRSTAPTS